MTDPHQIRENLKSMFGLKDSELPPVRSLLELINLTVCQADSAYFVKITNARRKDRWICGDARAHPLSKLAKRYMPYMWDLNDRTLRAWIRDLDEKGIHLMGFKTADLALKVLRFQMPGISPDGTQVVPAGLTTMAGLLKIDLSSIKIYE